MRYCPNCGNTLPLDVSNCPYCGAPCASHKAPPSPADTNAMGAAVSSAESSTQPAHGPRYAPAQTVCPDGGLTTAQYFWSLLLFSIPIIGWIFLFYWAFGAHAEAPRQRLARAALMKGCVWLVIFAIILSALAVVFFQALNDLTDAWYHYQDPSYDPFSDYYDAPFSLPDSDSSDRFYFEDPDFVPESPSYRHSAARRSGHRGCFPKRGSCNSPYTAFCSGRCCR